MRIDRRIVSRKTPRDGKLEISEAAAARLAEVGTDVAVEWNGATAPAELSQFSCSCGKAGGAHEHHFLQSPILASLPVGAEVDLFLRAQTVHVALTHSG
jgi:hypothetical protein